MRLCPPQSFPHLGTQLFPPKPPDTPFPPGEAALCSQSVLCAGLGRCDREEKFCFSSELEGKFAFL